ncbi:MAG TPA: arabinan endo-1,5-alpha-L-arabinosidase [Prolixibacteraceae bacterium]|nr:arabinan endo-1,5-alpha-L-arabinosidase [Prolixibacteraceae bacterium]
MKYSNLIRVIGILLFAISCGKDNNEEPVVPDPIVVPVENTRNDSFVGPAYADNYTPIANWSTRDQWNLANVHDPSVEKCGEYYYMVQTDASYGNAHEGHGHYPYRRSKDLVNWEFLGMAFQSVPAWVKDSLNNKRARMIPALPSIENPNYGCWAPCIRKVGSKYRLYYSVVVSNPIVGTDTNTSWSERAFIGLAESDDLATNVWVDKGMVVCSEPDGVVDYYRSGGNDWNGYYKFNAIDPSFIVTPEGQHWLIYGSWHSGIAAVQLNPDTGKPDQWESSSDYGVRIAGRGNVTANRWQGLEAPEIIYNPETKYYYLFLAYDELSVAYNTRVARSTSITGPYLGIDGQNVTSGAECWPMLTHPYAFNNHTGWVGISHCGVFQNPDTKQWYYTSQARLPENVPGVNASNYVMMGHVREILWTEDGWPVVSPERYAAVPQLPLDAAAVAGNYEVIILDYQYKTMQKSGMLRIVSNGTASGILSGTWTLDADKKIIQIGNQKLFVNDGYNWEGSPRKATLVLSGLTATGRSVWGKMIR